MDYAKCRLLWKLSGFGNYTLHGKKSIVHTEH